MDVRRRKFPTREVCLRFFHGLWTRIDGFGRRIPLFPARKSGAAVSQLPQGAASPQAGDAKVFSARLNKVSQEMKSGEAVYLDDDWRTQGDWIGRYGNGYALLCGAGESGDQAYPLQPGYEVSAGLPHGEDGGVTALARFREKEANDADRRLLYDPTFGHRRAAAVLANSSKPGKDKASLSVKIKVPDGVHCLSFYFVDYDAHEGDPGVLPQRTYGLEIRHGKDSLAHTQVADFWGGVYKQFIICGPADYTVRIDSGKDAEARLEGVFLDRVSGDMPENPGSLPGFDNSPYGPPDEPLNQNYPPLADAAVTLWGDLDDALTLRNALPLQMPFRLWCYRAAVAGQAPADLLERWRWQISLWTPQDRQRFDAAVKAAHTAAP